MTSLLEREGLMPAKRHWLSSLSKFGLKRLFPNTYDLLKVAGELAEAWRDGSSSWGGGLSLLFVLFFFFWCCHSCLFFPLPFFSDAWPKSKSLFNISMIIMDLSFDLLQEEDETTAAVSAAKWRRTGSDFWSTTAHGTSSTGWGLSSTASSWETSVSNAEEILSARRNHPR